MLPRQLHPAILHALAEQRVVLLQGARGVGKATLAGRIASEHGGSVRLSLADPANIARLHRDPGALLEDEAPLTILEEVQHASELVAGLVARQAQRRGRLLLTASRDVRDELRGNSENIVEFMLNPLNHREKGQKIADPASLLFGPGWPAGAFPGGRTGLCEHMLAGGLPGAPATTTGRRRDRWFRDHITNLLQRDVRELSPIDGLPALPGLLELLAARSGALLNIAEIARAAGLAHSTLRRYLALLETLFLYRPLPAWVPDSGPRCVRSPKIHLLDSGLAAWLTGAPPPARLARSAQFTPLFTTFVVQELRHQLAASTTRATPWHFSTATGHGVDLVLEDPDGRIAGIAVRAGEQIGADDFRGLRTLAKVAGGRFVRGAVVYAGDQCLPISDRLGALPVAALWS